MMEIELGQQRELPIPMSCCNNNNNVVPQL